MLGERIKRLRTFWDLSQCELGLKLGYEECNADVRIAQYETGASTTKYDLTQAIERYLFFPDKR